MPGICTSISTRVVVARAGQLHRQFAVGRGLHPQSDAVQQLDADLLVDRVVFHQQHLLAAVMLAQGLFVAPWIDAGAGCQGPASQHTRQRVVQA